MRGRPLLVRGIAPECLQRIFAPIGLDIKSETAEEIAVSVAAQLIAAKNRPVFETVDPLTATPSGYGNDMPMPAVFQDGRCGEAAIVFFI